MTKADKSSSKDATKSTTTELEHVPTADEAGVARVEVSGGVIHQEVNA